MSRIRVRKEQAPAPATPTETHYDHVILETYHGPDREDSERGIVTERFVTRLVSQGVLAAILGERPEWPKHPDDIDDAGLAELCFEAVYAAVMSDVNGVESETTFYAGPDENGAEVLNTKREVAVRQAERLCSDEELARASAAVDECNPALHPINFALRLRVENPLDPEEVLWVPIVEYLLEPEPFDSDVE